MAPYGKYHDSCGKTNHGSKKKLTSALKSQGFGKSQLPYMP
jgi:hypothetical protein